MRNVMIFHFGRSGSTVLQYAMNSHPDIVTLGEIYTHVMEVEKADISSPQDFVRILADRQAALTSGEGKKVCFFELKSGNFINWRCHVQLADALDALKGQIDDVIVLRRKNILHRIVSAQVAHMTGIYHVGARPDAINRTQREKLKFPTEKVIDYATAVLPQDLLSVLDETKKREQATVDVVAGKFNNVLFLNYEDDIKSDINIAASKIFSHFGILMVPLRAALEKTSRGLRNDLSNFDAIEALLQGTPHAWMLE